MEKASKKDFKHLKKCQKILKIVLFMPDKNFKNSSIMTFQFFFIYFYELYNTLINFNFEFSLKI